MSTLTKEQVLKFAAAWQAMIVLVTWYVNTIGIDTLNRLLFGLALVIALVILFLRKDDTEKVAVAVGTVDRFLKSQAETEKAKEASEKQVPDIEVNPALKYLVDLITSAFEGNSEPKTQEKPEEEEPEVESIGKENNKEEDGTKAEEAW